MIEKYKRIMKLLKAEDMDSYRVRKAMKKAEAHSKKMAMDAPGEKGDTGWRTTENGKHYQINAKGDVIKGPNAMKGTNVNDPSTWSGGGGAANKQATMKGSASKGGAANKRNVARTSAQTENPVLSEKKFNASYRVDPMSGVNKTIEVLPKQDLAELYETQRVLEDPFEYKSYKGKELEVLKKAVNEEIAKRENNSTSSPSEKPTSTKKEEISFSDRDWDDKFEALPDGTTYTDPHGYSPFDGVYEPVTWTKHGDVWESDFFGIGDRDNYEFINMVLFDHRSSVEFDVPSEKPAPAPSEKTNSEGKKYDEIPGKVENIETLESAPIGSTVTWAERDGNVTFTKTSK